MEDKSKVPLSTNSICFEGICRIYRNSCLRYFRSTLKHVYPEDYAQRIKGLFTPAEWQTITKNAEKLRETGEIESPLIDSLDVLGVNHFYNIFDRYYNELLPTNESVPEETRKAQKRAILDWAGVIKRMRNPVTGHPAEIDITIPDARVLLDAARRILVRINDPSSASKIETLMQNLKSPEPAPTIPTIVKPDLDASTLPPSEPIAPAMTSILRNPYKCDNPPVNNKWVGRTSELQHISNPDHKVIFITGIGGQGKSGLASHYITNVIKPGVDCEYWDWRDLKEEDNRLNSKLIPITERLSDGEVKALQLKDSTTDDLVQLLFYYLKSRKVVFVFDNIDSYIDKETFAPINGVDKLVQSALNQRHDSKFIFTCRPNVKFIGVGFFQWNLGGLTLEDTAALFDSYRLAMRQEDKDNLVREAFELTHGHAYWLNLIAAQATKGKDNADRFINGIKSNKSEYLDYDFSTLSENVLRTVWNSLDSYQRKLLRYISETVRAESEETLGKIIEGVLHYHRYIKALQVLKSLNLIVVKSAKNEPDLLELHPLVKSFVIKEYSLREREKYISIFVDYFDRLIYIYKPNLSEQSGLSTYLCWIDKIELSINKEDFEAALYSLDEITPHVIMSGYGEEYLRVAHLLFTKIDWATAISKSLPRFEDQLMEYASTMIEFGRFDEIDLQLDKYHQLIKEEDSEEYYHMKCYLYWYKGEFDSAVKWGLKHWDILKASKGDSTPPPTDLLLSWRDSRSKGNIEKALEGFLEDRALEYVLGKDPPEPKLGHDYYGNIGRCLAYQDRLDEAMTCYKKSLLLLYQGKSILTLLNKGYACLWIAEILMKQGKIEDAALFYRNAILKWNHSSPPRARPVELKLIDIIKLYPNLEHVATRAELEVDKACRDFLS